MLTVPVIIKTFTTERSIVAVPDILPVSYTHLDVYKRQGEMEEPDCFSKG